MFSCVRLLATPWTAAHQAPPSMGFSRQEYCVPWGYSISEVVVRVKWEMAHSHYSINVAYLYAWNIVLRLTINNSKLLQPFSINCPVFKNDSCALSLNFSNFCLFWDVDSSSLLSLERPSLLLRDKTVLYIFLEGGLFEYKMTIVIFSIYSKYCFWYRDEAVQKFIRTVWASLERIHYYDAQKT